MSSLVDTSISGTRLHEAGRTGSETASGEQASGSFVLTSRPGARLFRADAFRKAYPGTPLPPMMELKIAEQPIPRFRHRYDPPAPPVVRVSFASGLVPVPGAVPR